ncbi:cytochrome P450 9e2-like [Tribolium madens]|uniref:cytochrome P450 9e2-like n=1 Tax=Tribolium madens TaxID=41895 RepID=UPI001CF73E8E|nr:cytochrome P450 9e2-like [Tribolium madens]
MFWALILAAVLLVTYWLLSRPYKYWTERGVKQGKPVFIFGDYWGPMLRKQTNAEVVDMLYKIDKDARYCGIYQFLTPVLLIRDPELIKKITVKDFEHFVDHRIVIPEESDPLSGQKWRDMRSTLSPVFTSSKLKYMFSLISERGEQFAQNLLKENKDVITLDIKNSFTRYTNDVMASTMFGIQCDSLEEPKNEFYSLAQKSQDFSGFWKNVKLLGYFLFPEFCKSLEISFYSKEVNSFFEKLVTENIGSRQKHGIVRPDLIHLLMEAKNHAKKSTGYQESNKMKTEITDQDIATQALIFFFGGFDTVASLMSFMSYELATNPDCQEKLRQEVDEVMQNCDGKVTYEAIVNMKYMDMVTSETLRKWPNAPAVDRVCTKPYTIEPTRPDEKPIHLKENDTVLLPIYALHRDPQYFPDPDRFDPERFSEENKANIEPYTYMPFGSGPRNCIGQRFALIETKLFFFYILANFELIPVERTQIPLKLTKNPFTMTAEKGFWLGFKKRVKQN